MFIYIQFIPLLVSLLFYRRPAKINVLESPPTPEQVGTTAFNNAFDIVAYTTGEANDKQT